MRELVNWWEITCQRKKFKVICHQTLTLHHSKGNACLHPSHVVSCFWGNIKLKIVDWWSTRMPPVLTAKIWTTHVTLTFDIFTIWYMTYRPVTSCICACGTDAQNIYMIYIPLLPTFLCRKYNYICIFYFFYIDNCRSLKHFLIDNTDLCILIKHVRLQFCT